MNAELVAIIAEELAAHTGVSNGGYAWTCECGDEDGYEHGGHTRHQAERIAARLGIEEARDPVSLFHYRVRALEQREETSALER